MYRLHQLEWQNQKNLSSFPHTSMWHNWLFLIAKKKLSLRQQSALVLITDGNLKSAFCYCSFGSTAHKLFSSKILWMPPPKENLSHRMRQTPWSQVPLCILLRSLCVHSRIETWVIYLPISFKRGETRWRRKSVGITFLTQVELAKKWNSVDKNCHIHLPVFSLFTSTHMNTSEMEDRHK